MWRFILLTPALLLGGTSPALAADTEADPADDEDIPVLRIHNDEPGDTETIMEMTVDDDADAREDEQEEPEPPDFILGYVDWDFTPIIEVRHATGAVTEADVQRTIEADEAGIANCFEPTSYPGEGAVEVDVHLSYNGVPTSVNGNTDQIVRPNQARCILRRAWRYNFPRPASAADQPSQLGYRVTFTGQRVDAPETDLARPQLLLERVITPEEGLKAPMAQALADHLPTVESCAAEGLEELSTDVVATRVEGHWIHDSDGQYRPTDMDITVTNKTSAELPSADVVECYRNALSRWDFKVDADEVDELPDRVTGSFYVTVRPAGWYGI